MPAQQLSLFAPDRAYQYIGDTIAMTHEIATALCAGAPVAFGISGGKDGSAAASATCRALDAMGHAGPRILIHADLGSVEWAASLPTCERLADRLGMELVVVRRPAGGLMERWQTRWANNVQRYADLACVKLILPWSTAAMRFCTSELKVAVICRELIRRFPGQTIISASGIRRQESATRAKALVSEAQPRLSSVTHKTSGLDWHPIIDWQIEDVWREHDRAGLPVHPAYTAWDMSRVSCKFCIMASRDDLVRSAACPENQENYRDQVDLELTSTFSFRSDGWLADLAPHLLTEAQRAAVPEAKRRAKLREEAEAAIPSHLLYVKGWPVAMPTWSEAVLLADVRQRVARAVGLEIICTTPEAIMERYSELLREKTKKAA